VKKTEGTKERRSKEKNEGANESEGVI